MGAWAGHVLAVIAVVAAAGCTADADGEPAPARTSVAVSPTSSTSVAPDPASSTVGVAAPRRGDPGFDELPRCFGERATILGSPQADRIAATRRDDTIVTFGGDDIVTGVGPEDRVCAAGGNDRVSRPADVTGMSTFGVDLGAGDDNARLAVSAFVVYGGPGADRITIDRNIGSLVGGPGPDRLRSTATRLPRYVGPENWQCVDFAGTGRGVHVDLEQGRATGAGRDRVVNFHCAVGTGYADTLIGTPVQDGLRGGAGADLVRTAAGEDSAAGGSGPDRVYIGPGNDYGNGEDGRDRLYGGAGADSLEGWTDGDYLDGGPGNDQLYAALFCSIGGNSYDTSGLLDSHPNELFAGPGDDYLVGDRGNDRLDGGPGYDVGQGGFRDGRIDWIESTERLIDGCLVGPELNKPFDPGVATPDAQ